MKLKYKSTGQELLKSIYIKRLREPHKGSNWHFHKEFELIYFLKGHGMRIVGDHISNFKEGELVLVGEWLPHLWRNDVNKYDVETTDFIVLKFPFEIHGIKMFSLPEFSDIRVLLKKAKRGVLFSERVLDKIHPLFIKLCNGRPSQQLINVFNILDILSNEKEYKLLSKADFTISNQVLGEHRLKKVIDYVATNYNQQITLEEISKIAIMSPVAFCRYFKASTNKTFSHFLNEIRVSKACQLLINSETSIKQICFNVGFNSLTNFNRTFRIFKNKTPSKFRSEYKIFQN